LNAAKGYNFSALKINLGCPLKVKTTSRDKKKSKCVSMPKLMTVSFSLSFTFSLSLSLSFFLSLAISLPLTHFMKEPNSALSI
jgi:hypothetical protein